MKKIFYSTLACMMALAASANYLSPAAEVISADAMPAAAPAVTAYETADRYHAMTSYRYTGTTGAPEPVIVFDSWKDVYRDAHFRYASEYSDHSNCVVREVLDNAKTVRIPEIFSNGSDYRPINGSVVGVEYDGTTVRAGEGMRQRELVMDSYISFLTLYDFSADETAEDNPENYYDLFTSLLFLNPKCSIDIPQIDAIVKLLHKNGLELTIRGLEGSSAEKFAKQHGLPFENALKTDGNFTFCMHADHVSVYKWEEDDQEEGSIDVMIPAEVNGLPVTEIEDNAFLAQYSIRTVDIPDTVTRIGESAFWHCKNLKAVHIPASLCEIGESAFYETSLESAELPDSVTAIGKNAFHDCGNLTSVRLPDGLKKIPAGLFQNAESLLEVTVPDSVTVIDSDAFAGCKQLKTLVLSEQLCEIGENAFSDCAFSSIEIPESVTQIGMYAFMNCCFLESINIPKGVDTLDSYTFFNCTALERAELPEGLCSMYSSVFAHSGIESIDIPDSCTIIGYYAFEECENLKSVHLPEDLLQLGDSTFRGCTALKTVQLPQKLETVMQGVFSECSALETLEFPNTVTVIDTGAMSGCTSLKTVHLPEHLTEISDFLFYGCEALKEIEIPASVTYIGWCAFEDCPSLASVTVLAKKCRFDDFPFGISPTSGLTLIGYKDSATQQAAQDNFLLFKSLDDNSIITPNPVNALKFEIREDGAWMTGLKVQMTEVTIPAEYRGIPVVGIANEACYGMKIKHLVLPDTVKYIGNDAFNDCGLETVRLPKNLQTIGIQTFANCDMESVVIPDSVTVLSYYAFADCKNLTAITIPNKDCTVEDFLSQSYIEQQQDMERAVPKLYGVKDSALHGYADWLGIPFCTLDGTPVTEPSAVKYQPKPAPWETPEDTEYYESGTYPASTTKTLSAETSASAEDYIAGDINQSGTLTVADAVLLARLLAEDPALHLTEEGIRHADMNGSGTPDAEDLTMILKRLANLL